MNTDYSKCRLVRYLYRELDPIEQLEVEHLLGHSEEAAHLYQLMEQAKRALDTPPLLSPPTVSLHDILRYSQTTAHLTEEMFP